MNTLVEDQDYYGQGLITCDNGIIEFENAGGATGDIGVIVNFYETLWTGNDIEG